MYLKEKIFADELQLIENKKIQGFATYIVNHLPDYFFEVPASSTGKYHSDTCLGSGGLVRHTKAAVMFANSLMNDTENNSGLKSFDFSPIERSKIITALIAHDGWKHGLESSKSKFTTFDHPLVAARKVIELSKDYAEQSECYSLDMIEIGTSIASLIGSHMGRWNTNSRSKEVLPEPDTDAENFVHLCDYLASRSFLDFRFDKNGCCAYRPENFCVQQDIHEEIDAIISAGKAAIERGVSAQLLYDTVYKHSGVRNPKRIKDSKTAQLVKKEIENLVSE